MSSLIFPKWVEKKWDDDKRAKEIKAAYHKYYKEDHVVCPNCKSDNIASTTGPFGPTPYQGGIDINKAWCVCGWIGRVDDLVPREIK